MAAHQQVDLLALLKDRLRGGDGQAAGATAVYEACCRVLESETSSSASLSPETGEDIWRPCIVWLIKSIPGLLGEAEQQPADGARAGEPSAVGLPLSDLLNASHTNLVSFFKELPVVLNKLKPTLLELAGSAADNIEQQLKLREWQETLVSLQHISNKYKASGRFSLLKALCIEARVDYGKAKALMPQIEDAFTSTLAQAQLTWLPQPLPAAVPHPQGDKLETCCRLYLDGLTSKPQQLSELVLSLDEAYSKFLSSQLGQPGPATPISQAMGSVAWLKGAVKGLALQPPAGVQRYKDAAGADAGRVLSERVAAAAAAGVKMYWHVLETMLRAEEGRAGLAAACSLLTRWPFHQCLLACCFELVAASYRMGLLSFPAIPSKLGLKPFDLSKMIGPFVKAVPGLPRELKRHMFTVEEKILESLGWAAGSSFYKLARAAGGQQQQQQQQAAAEPAASAAACSRRRRRRAPARPEAFAPAEPAAPLPPALGAPGSPLPAGADASARAVLHDHCRKVLKLAAFRLVAVSNGLDFAPMESEDVLAAVHEVLSHALYHHTRLFYSRHLDTLLLASLYGFCKVNRLQQITFREIISHYKRQAHAKQEVFRTVALQQTDPGLVTQSTGDIIAFYNAVFVPVMKNFLLTTVQQPAASGNGSSGARSDRQNSGELPAASEAAATAAAQPAGSQSPIHTALMHAAHQQQQQQQRGWGGGVAAGGGTSSTYRALSLVGGGGGVEGLGLNGASGSSLSSLSGFGRGSNSSALVCVGAGVIGGSGSGSSAGGTCSMGGACQPAEWAGCHGQGGVLEEASMQCGLKRQLSGFCQRADPAWRRARLGVHHCAGFDSAMEPPLLRQDVL
ncbi:cyclin-like protein [Scenedesmus sp. NREL 46B-D3]|nr:cyclin-like protein [Scenedesmus sp. NREL 46B-D3]